MEVRAEYLNDLRQDLGPGDADPIDEMLKRMLRSEKRPVQIINPGLQRAGTCIFEQYLWNRKEDGMVDIARCLSLNRVAGSRIYWDNMQNV